MARLRKPRRGIVLLMVLSLLVLFLLMGVTFLIVSSQFLKGAEAQANVALRRQDPESQLEQVLYQLLCGTNVPSSIQGHGILEDLYGADSVKGTVVATNVYAPNPDGQLLQIEYTVNGTTPNPRVYDNYYAGRVLTMLSGPARNVSSRILRSNTNIGTSNEFILVEALGPVPDVGDELLINGQVFNGAGAGFNSAAAAQGRVNRVDASGREFALRPNFVRYTTPSSANSGGADEPWDAVDFQNMFLAMVEPDGGNIIPSFHRPALINYWFNRIKTDILAPIPLTDPTKQTQTILNPYGTDGEYGTADDPTDDSSTLIPKAILDDIITLKSQFIMRPPSLSNPDFTGSNPNYDHISGPWDVDNDGDGYPDSIWIDVGLPFIKSADGRALKPLVAILVKDLDGLLNLNAHGNLAQDETGYTGAVTPDTLTYADGTTSKVLPRGRGRGPAEIHFGHIFGSEFGSVLAGRYGNNGVPGEQSVNDPWSKITSVGIPVRFSNTALANVSNYNSPPDVWGRDAVALDYTGNPVWASLDDATVGEFPTYTGVNSNLVDDPYELDLSPEGLMAQNGDDAPYTLAELEPLLRAFDADSNYLPDRLVDQARSTFVTGSDAIRKRNLVTTDSRDIPIPNVGIPPERFASVRTDDVQIVTKPTIWDLYFNKLDAALKNNTNPTIQQARNDLFTQIIPFEMRRGGRFNINRSFGDGHDTPLSDDGVVDDPAEAAPGTEEIWSQAGLPAEFSEFTNALFNHHNDDALSGNGFSRQIYARHLYCLMIVLTDNGYLHPLKSDEIANLGGVNINAVRRELTARRLAQWAINIVDFRDPDAIMSSFEYDVNPFNGWDVDGNPASNDANDGVDNDGDGIVDYDDVNGNGMYDGDPPDEADEQDRRIVWGCEYPELLLTESFATHDRRLADTPDDSNERDYRRKNNTDPDEEGDDDLDQFRIPQGSLFLELYCTRSPTANSPQLPRELYDMSTGELDLGRLSPSGTDPVWRVAITNRHGNTQRTVRDRSLPANVAGSEVLTDTTSFDPNNMTLVPNANDPLTIDRYVWFAQLNPANVAGQPSVYYNHGSPTKLEPGRYAIVGPRAVTYMGARNAPPSQPGTTQNSNAYQYIQLRPNVDIFQLTEDGLAASAYSSMANKQDPIGIVCAADAPPMWETRAMNPADVSLTDAGIGLNISEPNPLDNYYPAPEFDMMGGGVIDGYEHPDPTMRPNALGFPDTPFDESATRPLGKAFGTNTNLLRTGTYADFKTAFLQRLANPLVDWNPEPGHPDHDNTLPVNPYVTVDWEPIDLTVFNGEDEMPSGWTLTDGANPNQWDPTDPNPDGAPTERFETRERGLNNKLWRTETATPAVTGKAFGTRGGDPGNHFFRFNLAINTRHTLGYLNSVVGVGLATPASYVGAPPQPFPWLTWNNRPFDSPLELLHVPDSSPSRLLHEFNTSASGATPPDPYYSLASNQDQDRDAYRLPFAHLPNLFYTNADAASPGVNYAANEAPHYYRLFDFVETPSPFIKTKKWYNPLHFGNTTIAAADYFRPPFNYTSRFRDPGRVNVNTIFDKDVWRGVIRGQTNSSSAIDASWLALQRSRQGYGSTPITPLNTGYPTIFANPFRPATAAHLVPLPNMERHGTNVTLLRGTPDSNAEDSTAIPLFGAYDGNISFNRNRNPYFRYQNLTRLGNLLTNHSNVFAIWITMGYFEVQFDATGDHLTFEAGSLTGNVTRNRIFSIVDRSIPVGHETGKNHNIDKAILIRRMLD